MGQSALAGVPKATVGEGWSGTASPVVVACAVVDGGGTYIFFLLDTEARHLGQVAYPLVRPDGYQHADLFRPEPGGKTIQVASSFERSERVPGPSMYRIIDQIQDGPWSWDPRTGEKTRIAYPEITSFPDPLPLRDETQTRYGVIRYHRVDDQDVFDFGFVDPITGTIRHPAYDVDEGGGEYPQGDRSSSPGGQLLAAARSDLGPDHLADSVVLLDTRDGSLVETIPSAHLVGSNGWSPTGRYLMIYDLDDPAGENDLDWWIHDTHTRHRVDLTRGNAADFGPLRRPANLIGWIDDTTVILNTTKGRHTAIFQTLDLTTGHRIPILTATHEHLPGGIFGVPDTMHLWDPLL